MDSGSVIQLVTIVILLIFSAFFSSAETALTTVNKHKLRAMYEEKQNKRAGRVLKLIENKSKLLSAILIGNNIVNLSASSLATIWATEVLGDNGAGIATGVLTLLVLVFGEITPKSLATAYNVKLSLIYVDIIRGLTFVLTPVIWFVNGISNILFKILHVDANHAAETMTESELRTIVNASHEDGVIEGEEKEMITNVVDFGDSITKDIMIPRVDMAFASIDSTFDELLEIYMEEQYTRLPVYEESKDNVVGILNLKDLFFYNATHKEKFEIKEILREPFFTYEFQKTSDLLRAMRKQSQTMAIVLDEYGVTAGLVTIEDLIEEIVGDIRDEYDDEEQDLIQKIDENQYQVEGSVKLDDLNDAIGIHIKSKDYDSIGGHIIELLDHLPEENETAQEENITYKVLTVDKNRIDTVLILLDEKQEEKNLE